MEALGDESSKAGELTKGPLTSTSKEPLSSSELPSEPPRQALLHPYFFTPPLPAHHSELPIPQRGGKKARQGPQHQRDFHVEQPLEESLVDLELVAPYVIDA